MTPDTPAPVPRDPATRPPSPPRPKSVEAGEQKRELKVRIPEVFIYYQMVPTDVVN